MEAKKLRMYMLIWGMKSAGATIDQISHITGINSVKIAHICENDPPATIQIYNETDDGKKIVAHRYELNNITHKYEEVSVTED